MRNWIVVVASLVAPAPAFTASVQTHETGTPIVDLYGARTKQLMWRGTGTDTLSDKPEQNTAKMNKAVAQMFEQYPPTQK
jgi:hypothetical protein